jgi:uncharacterized membrane protein YccC
LEFEMPPEPLRDPINPAAEALELARLFHGLSLALDQFLLSDQFPADTPPEQQALLRQQAQDLEDVSHDFTAEAIKAILESIQPDLAKIKAVAKEAKTQLGHLEAVSKAISIAAAGLSAGSAIVSGNPLSIAKAAQEFAKEVVG